MPKNNEGRRIGSFFVSNKLLREALNTGHGANLFKGCVPLDVLKDWRVDRTEYVVWHPSFDIIPEYEVTPEYEAFFENGSIEPTWVRKAVLK